MNDTVSLLKETNAGCKSATNAMELVMPHIENPQLRDLVDGYNTRHARIGEECTRRLHALGAQEKDPHPIAATMARISISVQANVNPREPHLADLLADGCAMGIRSLARYRNQYPAASAESLRLTGELISLEQEFMRDLLVYL